MLVLALALAVAAPLEREPDYRVATAAYDAFEFEEARRAFERLEGRPGLSAAERARLRLWVGMCHAEEGALDAAADDFEAAALFDVEVEALPVMSPKARRMLEEARKRALKRRPAARPPPLPDPDEEPDPPSATSPAAPAAPDRLSPLVVGGGAVLGVGGVAFAGALVAGAAALGAAADAAALPEARAAADRHAQAEQLALGANVGFVIGGIAAAAGVGLVAAGLVAGD